MSRIRHVFLLGLIFVFCSGMGSVGGYPDGTIPETDADIHAKVTDRTGVETSLSRFSMDGNTHIVARVGKGEMTIPFEQISSITFDAVQGDQVRANVKLKSGSVLDVNVRSRALFYGSTGFGSFKVKARDVSLLSFI